MPPNQHRFAKLYRELTGKTAHEMAPATDMRLLSQYWRDRTDLANRVGLETVEVCRGPQA